MTLAQAIENWMHVYKRNSVKPSTYDRLEVSLGLLEKHPISKVDPSLLTSNDIQGYLNDLVSDGYALTTIKKQFHLLTGYVRYANSIGEVERPICNTVALPTRANILKPERSVVSYSPIELHALLRVLQTHARPEYDVVLFMLETGTRIGEALAVEWKDVNWGMRSIRIDKTFVHLGDAKKSFVQSGAKSYSSNRTIPLSTSAMQLLTRLLDKANAPNGLIFLADGHPIPYEAMRWHIRRACEQAGVPYYGQHVFRHTFATNCYNRGCDVKILSKLLGHASVTVTYNTYIHLFGDALEDMRKVVG